MNKRRHWEKQDLINAVKKSRSIREVLGYLGLRQAGGNYKQIQKYILEYHIPTTHLTGKGWSRGLKIVRPPKIPLNQILKKNSTYQSFKLKRRLLALGMKSAQCEHCGWAEKTPDGRLPIELDHVNGDARDNRLENLRILCPNCHSLQPTHRGRNIKKSNKR